MPRPHPFLQLVPNRVRATLARVAAGVWIERIPLVAEATEPRPDAVSLATARRLPRRPVVAGECWGRLYDQRWVRVKLPATPRGPGWHLEWRDQGEATAHADGRPYFGYDVAHRFAPRPNGAREVWMECYCCQSAIWHPDATGLSPEGSRFEGVWLVRRDDEAWATMHDLAALMEFLLLERSRQVPPPEEGLTTFGLQTPLARATPRYRQLLRHLDEAVDAYDTGGLEALRRRLAEVYRDMRSPRPRLRAVLTGHAHLDLVWLWTEAMGEAKAVHTFATVDRLMAQYPELRFAFSQPASYEAVGRRAPALLEAVRGRINEGRWEATGVLHVESDSQLPCGEALARSFTLGQQAFEDLRGRRADLVWLPDVFGYSGCLPQLIRLAGAKWFFTTKLTWSAINAFPYSSFIWRGSDGSEVLAHVTQSVGYNNEVSLAQLHANANGHVQADVHPEFLHPAGYGDGGGGPTAEMCERARRLDALGDAPSVRWGQPEEFFARLARRQHRLPVWQGECYLEYHRGTYTSHGDLKAAFRGLERALQVREAAAVALGDAPDLGGVWRRAVFAQFHDYIPGSSVPEVYREGVAELTRLAEEQRRDTVAALSDAKAAGSACVFNPLPIAWSGWLRDPDRSGVMRFVEVPPLSGTALTAARRSAPPAARAEGRRLWNDRVQVTLDADGAIQTLVVDGRPLEVLPGAGLPHVAPDRPAHYDAWDIDRQSLDLAKPVGGKPVIRVESRRGPRASIVVRRSISRDSSLVVRYSLEAGAGVLRMEIDLDWHETETLLRLPFPTNYRGQLARFGAPFGSTLRGAQPGAPATEAQWEVPGSRWATISHDGEREGLFIVTEAKYGFSARDGVLAVTLVRSPRMTGFESRGVASPRALCREQPPSPFSDQGRAKIRLAIGRYDAHATRSEQPAALADLLFTCPLVYRGEEVAAPSGYDGISEGETLLPAWAVPRDGRRWVLRLHEVAGQAGRAFVRLAPGWRATPVNLLDQRLGRSLPADGGFDYRPYQIVSLLIEPAGATHRGTPPSSTSATWWRAGGKSP